MKSTTDTAAAHINIGTAHTAAAHFSTCRPCARVSAKNAGACRGGYPPFPTATQQLRDVQRAPYCLPSILMATMIMITAVLVVVVVIMIVRP